MAATSPQLTADNSLQLSSAVSVLGKQVSLSRVCIFIFLLAFLIRFPLVLLTHRNETIDHMEMTSVAKALATKGSFSDAYGDDTGPTAHVSPLYPLVLAAIYKTFGTGVVGSTVQVVLANLMTALLYASLPLVAWACGMGLLSGVLAGVLGALIPIHFWTETSGTWESVPAVLLLMALTAVLGYAWRRRDFSIRTAVVCGILCGLALLTTATFLSLAPALMLAGWLFFRRKANKEYLRFAAVFLAITFALQMPWAIRNKMALGAFILGRSNLGLELDIGNNGQAQPDFIKNHSFYITTHPFDNDAERAKVTRMGEVAYNKERLERARGWILSHPQRFVQLTAQRFINFWFPPMMRLWQGLVLGLYSVLGIAGVILFLRTRISTAWLFAAVLIVFPLPYYLVASMPRYSYPVEWILLLFSAWLIVFLCGGWKRTTQT